ncbi:hypothetical protein BGZ83_006150 [Gryganskiella cystojenkinii]|nr:hypothetical protein BGZ83_006150 [Gryganskiella cystojenkinii]
MQPRRQLALLAARVPAAYCRVATQPARGFTSTAVSLQETSSPSSLDTFMISESEAAEAKAHAQIQARDQDTAAAAAASTFNSTGPPKTPYQSPRFRKEQQQGRRPPRSNSNNQNNNRRFQDSPAPRFKAPPTIPYNATKELQFADTADWEVTSVLDPRPLYANVAAARGSVPAAGTVAVNQIKDNVTAVMYPGTAFSAHIQGVRSYGKLDPEVEQTLIQDLAAIQNDKDKDHRKSSDLSSASANNAKFLFHMTENFQEIMNPRNSINRFNNGNVRHVAGLKYEVGSDELSTDVAGEKSWRRLERIGGDYARASDPRSLLSSSGKESSETSPAREALLKNASLLVGQNQSIGLEDKKKMIKAVEHGLGSF